MLAGQKKRHGVCSPKLSCCDAHVDLVDLKPHMAQHAEVG